MCVVLLYLANIAASRGHLHYSTHYLRQFFRGEKVHGRFCQLLILSPQHHMGCIDWSRWMQSLAKALWFHRKYTFGSTA